ncbi:MAG: hypothetical protein ACREBS_06045 [Nitrososphaerales archaeon]
MAERNEDGKLRGDISKILVVLPETWSRSKRQYVRLVPKDSASGKSSSPVWIGRKYDFSPNGSKAKIEYGEDDIRKLEGAADSSIIQVKNDRGIYTFEKSNGEWIQVTEI